MIAHRRGRVIEIPEDARRPIRLAPRPRPKAGDGGTTIAPSAAPGGGMGV